MAVVVTVTHRGCKKVHFFCIFLQKYLHISKKSSIFAADLGIVPAITVKYFRAMKGKRVFAVHYNGKVYSIYELQREKSPKLTAYRTYVGRRTLDVMLWYTLTDAIASILFVIGDFDMVKFKEEWL